MAGARLSFDLDTGKSEGRIDALAATLEVSHQDVQRSFSRAISRTAASLRVLASKGLRGELGLARVSALRRRLKSIKLKKIGEGRYSAGIWFGISDMGVGNFEGRVMKTPGGAEFVGKKVRKSYPGAFVGRSKYKGRPTIFRRETKARTPLTEETVPVKDQMEIYIEDVILYEQLERVFFHHFEQDLRARVKFQFKSR